MTTMKPATFWIGEKDYEDAKKKAKKAGMSLSHLVRMLLRDFHPDLH